MLKVLLVDGHPLSAKGIQDLIQPEPELELIGVASTGQAARESMATHQPEVVVLDDNLPDMAATDLLTWIHQQNLSVRVLIFSAEGNANAVHALLEVGARGYLLKSGAGQELLLAIKSIARGHQWFSQEIGGLLASTNGVKSAIAVAAAEEEEEEEEKGKLPHKQREILRRVALGHTDAQIALELGVTTKAINRQLERILVRLDAPNRTNAVYQAAMKRWI
ncbi:MAG TPA: response regulator transcription factor [Anaerolineales bacterium]|nr:response regulator transcription factor [Anaerolineales bacterium]